VPLTVFPAMRRAEHTRGLLRFQESKAEPREGLPSIPPRFLVLDPDGPLVWGIFYWRKDAGPKSNRRRQRLRAPARPSWRSRREFDPLGNARRLDASRRQVLPGRFCVAGSQDLGLHGALAFTYRLRLVTRHDQTDTQGGDEIASYASTACLFGAERRSILGSRLQASHDLRAGQFCTVGSLHAARAAVTTCGPVPRHPRPRRRVDRRPPDASAT